MSFAESNKTQRPQNQRGNSRLQCGAFVGKCLSTLVHQTFQDFEIIAVNDGSKDGSLAILREFERNYVNMVVIDQPNAGMSMARNRGMEAARGEYLCFVDSDDYVSPYFLEELYRAVTENGADIACCYYYYHFVRSDVLYKYPFRCHGVFSRDVAMNKLLHDTQIQSLVWNKIYKRSLFTDYGITFPTMAFEDLATANKLFSHANKVVVVDKALYYYNQQSTSTLATINADKINDFIRATAMVRATLESVAFTPITKRLTGPLPQDRHVLSLLCAEDAPAGEKGRQLSEQSEPGAPRHPLLRQQAVHTGKTCAAICRTSPFVRLH